MAILSNNDIARALYLVSKDKSHIEQSAIFKNFTKFLFKKRLLSKAQDIISNFEKIINKEEGRVVVKVLSALKLDYKMKLELEHFLKKRYLAREIALEEILDEKLLGGVRVEVNNEVIDLSIKNRIGKLKEHLITS